jgi:hypothetical protein
MVTVAITSARINTDIMPDSITARTRSRKDLFPATFGSCSFFGATKVDDRAPSSSFAGFAAWRRDTPAGVTLLRLGAAAKTSAIARSVASFAAAGSSAPLPAANDSVEAITPTTVVSTTVKVSFVECDILDGKNG